MESNTLVESSFSSIINAPIAKIDIPPGTRGGISMVLPSAPFNRCQCGAGWQAQSINVEILGGKPMVLHVTIM